MIWFVLLSLPSDSPLSRTLESFHVESDDTGSVSLELIYSTYQRYHTKVDDSVRWSAKSKSEHHTSSLLLSRLPLWHPHLHVKSRYFHHIYSYSMDWTLFIIYREVIATHFSKTFCCTSNMISHRNKTHFVQFFVFNAVVSFFFFYSIYFLKIFLFMWVMLSGPSAVAQLPCQLYTI